jgi:anti-anti-sigma regulatory factor
MTTNGTWFKVDEKHTMQDLQTAANSVDWADSELVIDCSELRRLDPHAVATLEALANKADEQQVKVVLHGVKVDVYKVLRLVKLTARFSFTD